MGFWNNIQSTYASMTKSVGEGIHKFKNNDFADAAMAMCALVAAADGDIDRTERQKTAGFIASNETLKVFDRDDLKSRFGKYCDKLEADFDFGKIDALAALGKLRKNETAARTCIQVGILIGGADGDFDPDEKAVVAEACKAMGLDSSEFDL